MLKAHICFYQPPRYQVWTLFGLADHGSLVIAQPYQFIAELKLGVAYTAGQECFPIPL
jgi:hypothetical protein